MNDFALAMCPVKKERTEGCNKGPLVPGKEGVCPVKVVVTLVRAVV
jgi:hypothetical protein